MEGLFSKFISSPIFTFQVGDEQEKIMVHSGPIAALSPALNSLLSGGMKEARLREVHWPEVTKETFARLCEFAYMQDYTPPAFEKIPRVVKSPTSSPRDHEFWDDWYGWSSSQRRKEERENRSRFIPPRLEIPREPEPEPEPEPAPESMSEMVSDISACQLHFRELTISARALRSAFAALNYTYTPVRRSPRFEPIRNEGTHQDFTPVFLGHAEVYLLADKYGIEPLRQLVLSKLHRTMSIYILYTTSVASIMELVRFVYENTPSRSGEIDSLRKLTTLYVASILGQIGDGKDFGQLLVEGGDFVVDLWRIMRNTGSNRGC